MIGFVGIQTYDILLYLCKMLHALDQKILLVDYAENKALSYCIPMPKNQPNHQYISYQGCDFLQNPNYEKLQEIQQQYDKILIDFGFVQNYELLSRCSMIYLCTDQQLHHINAVKPFLKSGNDVMQRCRIIFRRIDSCKISIKYLMMELGVEFDVQKIYQYDQDIIDLKHCIDSQYNQTVHLVSLSKGMKGCLNFVMREICPNINRKQEKFLYKTYKVKVESVKHTLVSV